MADGGHEPGDEAEVGHEAEPQLTMGGQPGGGQQGVETVDISCHKPRSSFTPLQGTLKISPTNFYTAH